MKIRNEYITAIESLGYTPEEARFLYLAATFSGYFVPRQFVSFTGAKRGARSTNLTRKLQSRGHASWREYPHLEGVYHLWSKLLYRIIDKEQLRNCRRHSTDFIRRRLLTLDFILANQQYEYLETEADRIRYFREVLGLSELVFPAKEFGGPQRPESVVRYFVDQFPMYLNSSEDSSSARITLTYVDPGHASLTGFRHYLEAYQELLSSLPAFSLVYVSNSPVHFVRAEERFRSFVERTFQDATSATLLRYFRLRKNWEAKQFADFSPQDVESLQLLGEQLTGPDTERLYAGWRAGQTFTGGFQGSAGNKRPSPDVRFECRLLSSGRAVITEFELTG